MPSLSLKGWTLNLDRMGLKLVCVCISTLSTPWPGILVLLISWLILGLLTSWLSRMCCMASSLGGSVTKEPPHLVVLLESVDLRWSRAAQGNSFTSDISPPILVS